jgi:hypothetical protein
VSAGEADWELLGIAPTDDRRAIRVAYAQLLKAIDPETDPKAFIRLRNAYERATATAEGTMSTPTFKEVPSLAFAEAPAHAALPQEEDPAESHARTIFDLLTGNKSGHPWLEKPDQEKLRLHWHALIADPRMERLDHAARVELWASNMIAGTSPLSAAILVPAAEHFGWVDADHNVHSSDAVARIAQLYRLRQMLDAAAAPGSRHHVAWVELRRPAGEPTRPVRPYLVFELIAAMRYALPELSQDFDPVRIKEWEDHADDERTAYDAEPEPRSVSPRAAFYLTLLILFALVVLIGVINNMMTPE